ncbi:hypothetical protein [Marinobacter sp. S6332]|uniref:hypothetical protein n=1 Tax=Marinobacter sp. S6332 TaxID=2926403 RepID=UPI001FF476EB|nr:hypothetical protein [Marinobacter sp. S6332]MCK0162358.1 hypothetical protein [Marinobacter sp. S6332]
MPQYRFAALLSQYDFPSSLIYLAPVLPIVQVMWADGKNQMPERDKLHVIIQSHRKALSELAGGLQVVSQEDIDLFDQAFIANEPDMSTLQAFTDQANELLQSKVENGMEENESLYQRDRLLHACMEIAATCPAHVVIADDEMLAQRIVEEEQHFIEKVFQLLPKLN